MKAITPPPIVLQLHQAPDPLFSGAEMEFTLWMGPFPLRWLARIEDLSERGFIDRQKRGPFKQWVHHHRFEAITDSQTKVIDSIEIALKPHLLWGPIGLAMYLGLPFLFAFRAWKTKRLLESST